MDFSDEWKSIFPISSLSSPPLLHSSSSIFGPLSFTPSHKTLLTTTATTPSSPFPHLSLSRFLSSSHILPSTSSSISSLYGPHIPPTPSPYNSLHLLPFPASSSNHCFVFYPCGENSDQVGFLLLGVEDALLVVKASGAGKRMNYHIVQMLVQPIVADSCGNGNGSDCNSFVVVGYLLVCSMYGVLWYCVRFNGHVPKLEFAGSKVFRSSGIVGACWSPHLEEECVVLLESGELFMFDLGSRRVDARFKGRKLRVLWDGLVLAEKGSWVSCEFSWHPRILIVANSSAVFLVDCRLEECCVSCLLRIDMLVVGNRIENDRFVALSRAVSDAFHFTVASKNLLLLCDVRKPLMPVLQWVHGIDNPRCVDVVRLSELRSHSKNDKYMWASESGYCILMGSFWNCEFSLFCYGPDTRNSVASEISKFCNSFYAWELPSELSLSSHRCYCGSCIVGEEFSKDALPEWVDWQHKKEIVLGFGILDNDLSVQLSEPDDFGGFTLISLMSSGKIELQRYSAAWELVNFSEKAHNESKLLEESLLDVTGDTEYKFPKKFQYLKLDYLLSYLDDNLGNIVVTKKKKTLENSPNASSSNSDFHQNICQKLNACGISKFRSSAEVSYVLRDIRSPTSTLEIAIMNIWASLPPVLLRTSFVTYLELVNSLIKQKKVSLEFLDIPDQPHLPPFSLRNPSHRSSKWSNKLQPGNSFVGPVVPLHFLVTFNKLYMKGEAVGVSANRELELRCGEVLQMVNEVTVSDSMSEDHADHVVSLADDCVNVVSLADDTDEKQYGSEKSNHFSVYEPVACSNKSCGEDVTPESSTYQSENYSTFIHRKGTNMVASNNKVDMLTPEGIDSMCPTKLRFYDRPIKHLPSEFKYFIGQQKKFQESFSTNRSSFQKQKM